jgi:hypothetical protein
MGFYRCGFSRAAVLWQRAAFLPPPDGGGEGWSSGRLLCCYGEELRRVACWGPQRCLQPDGSGHPRRGSWEELHSISEFLSCPCSLPRSYSDRSTISENSIACVHGFTSYVFLYTTPRSVFLRNASVAEQLTHGNRKGQLSSSSFAGEESPPWRAWGRGHWRRRPLLQSLPQPRLNPSRRRRR